MSSGETSGGSKIEEISGPSPPPAQVIGGGGRMGLGSVMVRPDETSELAIGEWVGWLVELGGRITRDLYATLHTRSFNGIKEGGQTRVWEPQGMAGMILDPVTRKTLYDVAERALRVVERVEKRLERRIATDGSADSLSTNQGSGADGLGTGGSVLGPGGALKERRRKRITGMAAEGVIPLEGWVTLLERVDEAMEESTAEGGSMEADTPGPLPPQVSHPTSISKDLRAKLIKALRSSLPTTSASPHLHGHAGWDRNLSLVQGPVGSNGVERGGEGRRRARRALLGSMDIVRKGRVLGVGDARRCGRCGSPSAKESGGERWWRRYERACVCGGRWKRVGPLSR